MFPEAASEMDSSTPHRRREGSENKAEPFQSAFVRSDTLVLGPVDGVAPVDNPEAADIDAHSRVYRCVRDNVYAARGKGLDGNSFHSRRGVQRRRESEHQSFEVANQTTYEELVAWAAAVRAGEVTQKPIEVAV